MSTFRAGDIRYEPRLQLHDRIPRTDLDTGSALGTPLLIDHSKRLIEFDCTLWAVLLADSAPDAPELTYLFYILGFIM